MKKCNRLISLVLVILSLFVLFCGSLNVSAEVTAQTQRTTVDPYFSCATSCTCEEHMNFYTTTETTTEPGFSLDDEDMSKVSEVGDEVKGIGGFLHQFFAKFYEILNAILKLVGNLGNGSVFN